jgi:hypothetical protein
VRDALLLLLGGGLTLLGGYLSDQRTDRRENQRLEADRVERIRDKQRDAVVDVLSVSAQFLRTVTLIGRSLLANQKKGTDFTDQPFVDEHGVHGREMDRAVAVAQLLISDAPKTKEALQIVEAARKNLDEAWGKALTSTSTQQPLPMDLAGPIIQGEAVLEKAFERLKEAATSELVARSAPEAARRRWALTKRH